MLSSLCFIILVGMSGDGHETKMLIPAHQIGYVKKMGKDKYSTLRIDTSSTNYHFFEIKETAEEVAQIIKKECKL